RQAADHRLAAAFEASGRASVAQWRASAAAQSSADGPLRRIRRAGRRVACGSSGLRSWRGGALLVRSLLGADQRAMPAHDTRPAQYRIGMASGLWTGVGVAALAGARSFPPRRAGAGTAMAAVLLAAAGGVR